MPNIGMVSMLDAETVKRSWLIPVPKSSTQLWKYYRGKVNYFKETFTASQLWVVKQSWRKLCNKLLGILNRDRYLGLTISDFWFQIENKKQQMNTRTRKQINRFEIIKILDIKQIMILDRSEIKDRWSKNLKFRK
jgi:hypothetical protein